MIRDRYIADFTFLNVINLKNIYRTTLLASFSPDYASTMQRLLTKLIKDNTVGRNLNHRFQLKHIPFLIKLSEVIYSLYSKKKSKEFKPMDLEEIYSFVQPNADFRYDYNWMHDKTTGTLRKNGDKIIPTPGKYRIISSTKQGKDEITLAALNIENAKKEDKIGEQFHDTDHYWLIGDNFQTEGFSNRFYFNINPELHQFQNFLLDIQKWLNEILVPFKLKFPKEQKYFAEKTDNTVLYVPRENTLHVLEVIKRICNKYENVQLFDDGSPRFTYELAKGISFGESPDDRIFTSFGSYRAVVLSVILYQQLIDSKGEIDTTRFNSVVVDPDAISRFRLDKGVKKYKDWAARFYTNQHSTYDYRYHFNYFNNYKPKDEPEPDKSSYLYGAYKAACLIWNEAYFYPERGKNQLYANWFTCHSVVFGAQKQKVGYNYVAADGTFENGIPGIVFFLMSLEKVLPRKFNYTIAYRGILTFCSFESNKSEKELFFRLFSDFKGNRVFFPFRNKPGKVFELDLSRNKNLSDHQKLIDRVVFTDSEITIKDREEINKIKDDFLKGMPFRNFKDNFELDLSLGYGYALLGYFFLRLHDPTTFQKLPYTAGK